MLPEGLTNIFVALFFLRVNFFENALMGLALNPYSFIL
jgi:hypothetical protein